MNLNSFVTHTFEAREMPGKGGTCLGKDQTCRIGYFTVNKNDDQRKSVSFDEMELFVTTHTFIDEYITFNLNE